MANADEVSGRPLVPAAQYLRMSTIGQRFSLESQRALIAQYAERNGFEVLQSYEDAGRSGVTTRRRDGLKALLRDVVSDPRYSAILVTDVSRWGRYQDVDEAAHYEFVCREAGVQVIYCAESFADDGSLGSSMVKHLKRAMAAEYSRQLSDRVKAGQLRAAKRGDYTGGPAPYGFSREAYSPLGPERRLLSTGDRKGRQDWAVRLIWGPDDQVAVVRRIFRAFLKGLSRPYMIAQMLNDDGIAHSQPGAWTTARVKGVLSNELIVGTSTSSKSSGGMGRPRRRLDSSEWNRVVVLPAMISRAEFSLAQARLKAIHAGRMTVEELLSDLGRLLAVHGTLSKPIIEAYGRSSPVLYNRRFGSLQAAFRLVGFEREMRDYHHVEQSALRRENVLIGLKRLLAEKGRLSLTLINKVGYLPHGTTLIAHFGSMEALYEAVGYTSPHAHMLSSSRVRYPPRKSRKRQVGVT